MKMRSYIKIIIYAFIGGFACICFFYIYNIYQITNEYHSDYEKFADIQLRKFPYPYKAALTICSDADATTSADEFLSIQKYLNFPDKTKLGQGLDLEIGNSIFMYDPENNFSYFSDRPGDTILLNQYVNSGYVDALHSFGEKDNFTRDDAQEAISELKKLDKMLDVWIDHAYTIDNINGDLMGGEGDLQGSPAYHADLLIDYGVKFFWLGRVTSVFSTETIPSITSFLNILDTEHFFPSLITFTKEFVKHIFGVFRGKKYAMHRDYRLVKIKTLRDGQKVFEFLRTNSYWQSVDKGANAKGLAEVISKSNLKRLIENNGYAIVYTHLGDNANIADYLPPKTRAALENLSKENKDRNIYITTTSKLLHYYINRKYLKYQVSDKEDGIVIDIEGIFDPIDQNMYTPSLEELQGITFYVPRSSTSVIKFKDRIVETIVRNPADETGRESIMFPLIRHPLNMPSY